jgi:Protein of unknown function DUF58
MAALPQNIHSFIHRLIRGPRSVIKRRLDAFPITARAILILVGVTYLFAFPIRNDADIVAAVLAFSALGLVVGAFLFVVISGLRIKSRLMISLVPPGTGPSGEESLVAQRVARFVMIASHAKVPPCLSLAVSFHTPDAPEIIPLLRLAGTHDTNHRFAMEITFPHRGEYRITELRCELQDRAGLTRFAWSLPHEQLVTVAPLVPADSSIPPMSSLCRPGDLVTDLHNRRGELFDLKPYHPADGMKKIVWKIFAKSGQLLSRHPEPAMTPEGQVLVFVFARAEDDTTAGEAIAFCRKLEDLQLDIFLGCEGMTPALCARSTSAARDLLIDSAFRTTSVSKPQLTNELEAVLAAPPKDGGSESRISRVIIFLAPGRVTSDTDRATILSMLDSLSARGIDPVLCMPNHRTLRRSTGIKQWKLAHLFVALPESEKIPQSDRSALFLQESAQRHWEVFRIAV